MAETIRIPPVPVLGVGDTLGAGDSYLVVNLLPPELAVVAFEKIKNEVAWKTMHHRGELVEIPSVIVQWSRIIQAVRSQDSWLLKAK